MPLKRGLHTSTPTTSVCITLYYLRDVLILRLALPLSFMQWTISGGGTEVVMSGVQFWTVEADILCRLVFVKDVQLSDQDERSTPGEAPSSLAAGLTELPTCPVCLERLDDHISGIVTTVCLQRTLFS